MIGRQVRICIRPTALAEIKIARARYIRYQSMQFTACRCSKTNCTPYIIWTYVRIRCSNVLGDQKWSRVSNLSKNNNLRAARSSGQCRPIDGKYRTVITLSDLTIQRLRLFIDVDVLTRLTLTPEYSVYTKYTHQRPELAHVLGGGLAPFPPGPDLIAHGELHVRHLPRRSGISDWLGTTAYWALSTVS